MDDLPPPVEAAKLAFEREKWNAEQQRLNNEFALRKRELHIKEREAHRARLWNPLAIAIIGATLAAVGNAVVSWENGQANIQLETFRAEAARIFEVIKTGDPDKAAKNLDFLLQIRLIQAPETVGAIKAYLASRPQGQGVSLSSISSSLSNGNSLVSIIESLKPEQLESLNKKPVRAAVQMKPQVVA